MSGSPHGGAPLPPEPHFRVRADKVVAKVIDGEAIVINVLTGRYYSLEGAGADVWSAISQRPLSAPQLAQRVSEIYEVSVPQALEDVERLIPEMISQDLIEEAPGAELRIEPPNDQSATQPTEGQAGDRLPYAPLQLATFTDMEDLLAFDPPLPAAAPDPW